MNPLQVEKPEDLAVLDGNLDRLAEHLVGGADKEPVLEGAVHVPLEVLCGDLVAPPPERDKAAIEPVGRL